MGNVAKLDAGTGNWQRGASFSADALRATLGQRTRRLGLRVYSSGPSGHEAELPLDRLTAFELYRRQAVAGDGAPLEAEIERRHRLAPQPGEAGYWAAFNDAFSLVRGLAAAERAAAEADYAYATSFSDEARDRFDGSFAEFKAARLDRCVEAHDAVAALRDFAARFPLVAAMRTTRA
jgi:hypothetical protein